MFLKIAIFIACVLKTSIFLAYLVCFWRCLINTSLGFTLTLPLADVKDDCLTLACFRDGNKFRLNKPKYSVSSVIQRRSSPTSPLKETKGFHRLSAATCRSLNKIGTGMLICAASIVLNCYRRTWRTLKLSNFWTGWFRVMTFLFCRKLSDGFYSRICNLLLEINGSTVG